MKYGYARVSTAAQARDGHSLEAQANLLRENGAETIYSDNATAKNGERPALRELLDVLQQGDTLVVTRLDRIARSAVEGSKLIEQLIQRGVNVHILNIGMLDNSPTSKLIQNIFFVFAEFEHDLIMERMREGKAIARTKDGFKEGRPRKFTDEQIRHALDLLKKHSYREVEEMMGISKSTLIRAKRLQKNEM